MAGWEARRAGSRRLSDEKPKKKRIAKDVLAGKKKVKEMNKKIGSKTRTKE